MDKIRFFTEEDELVEFYVLEQTMLNGNNYLLVSEEEDNEEADAYIMREMPSDDIEESTYEIVEDETELMAVASIFEELLEDVDIISKD